MSSSIFLNYMCVLLFILLAVEVHSQNCGLSNYAEDPFKPLIMGGQNATEGQWPWMVAIKMRNETGPMCSGFLIDRKHVISAAHCYEVKYDDLYRARIGNINQSIADEYRITRISIHSGYRKDQNYHDIAVLTLDQEVNFPNFILVCLTNEQVGKINLNGRGTTIAGWGADRNGGDAKDYLQYLTQLPVMTNAECTRRLRRTPRLQNLLKERLPNGVTKCFICAAFKEARKDACGGDSGGPQMIQYENRWYAVGVVSFGVMCGIPGMPGGYTRIACYIDWIKQNTND